MRGAPARRWPGCSDANRRRFCRSPPASSWSRCRCRRLIDGVAAGRRRRLDPAAWFEAAETIMTTDTVPKAASKSFQARRPHRHGHRDRQGRRHDPAEHGDHARLRRRPTSRSTARSCRKLARRAADRSFNCITRRRRHVDQRFVRARRDRRQRRAAADRAPDDPRLRALEQALCRGRAGTGAGDRARRRRRHQVHPDRGRRLRAANARPRPSPMRSRIRRW